MSVEKAKAYYSGGSGCRKLNCAQSIVQAFHEKFSVSADATDTFAVYGGGRAPEGECGALYAAKTLLKNYPDRIKGCEDILVSHAGSTKCREIRSGRRLCCAGCVEKIAECLDNIKL